MVRLDHQLLNVRDVGRRNDDVRDGPMSAVEILDNRRGLQIDNDAVDGVVRDGGAVRGYVTGRIGSVGASVRTGDGLTVSWHNDSWMKLQGFISLGVGIRGCTYGSMDFAAGTLRHLNRILRRDHCLTILAGILGRWVKRKNEVCKRGRRLYLYASSAILATADRSQ